MKKMWILIVLAAIVTVSWGLCGCKKEKAPGTKEVEVKKEEAKPAGETTPAKPAEEKPMEGPAAEKPKDHPAH